MPKRKAVSIAVDDSVPYIFEILDSLPEDDHELNSVVVVFRSGADLHLQPEKLHTLAASLDTLREVPMDADSLDAMFDALLNLSAEGTAQLQVHQNVGLLCTLLYGLLDAPKHVALRAGKVYLSLLMTFNANASLIINSYFVRRLFGISSQFFAGSNGAAAALLTQEEGSTQNQSQVLLTPEVTASQFQFVNASQKPKREKKRKLAKKDDMPDNYQEVYELILHIVGLFQQGNLLRCLDAELSPVVVETLVTLPCKEMCGPLKGSVSHPSPLLTSCFAVLKSVMKDNMQFCIFEAEGEDEDPDASCERNVDGQQLVLPQLLPFLHLSLHYVHSSVRMSDANAMQKAALDLIMSSNVTVPNLLLLFKVFMFSAERHPRNDPIAAASKAGVAILTAIGKQKDAAGAQQQAVNYLFEISGSDKVFHRVFATEVAYALLRDADALKAFGVDGTQGVVATTFKAVSDIAPSVRMRAITKVSRIMQAIGDENCPARSTISTYMTRLRTKPLDPQLAPPTQPQQQPQSSNTTPTPAEPASATSGLASNISISPGLATIPCSELDYLVASVIARAREDKALVRKAAVDLLLQFFEHKIADATSILLSTFVELMDVKLESSVLVRREAVLCAWKVVVHATDVKVRSRMLAAILDKSTLEGEDYVIKTMLQAVQSLVIHPLTGEEAPLSAEEVWEITANFTDAQLSSLGKLCCKLLEDGEVNASIVASLLERINKSPGCRDAWAMLPVFAKKFKKKIDAQIIMKCFRTLNEGFYRTKSGNSRDHSVLNSVTSLLPGIDLSVEERQEVVASLEGLVLSLRCHLNLLNGVITCYSKLVEKSKALRMTSMFNQFCSTALYHEFTATDTHQPVGQLPSEVRAVGYDCIRRADIPAALCSLGSLLTTDVYMTSKCPDSDGGKLDLTSLAGLVSAACSTSDSAKALSDAVVVQSYIFMIRLCLSGKTWCTKGVPILLNGLSSPRIAVKTTCLNGLSDLSLKYPGTVDRYLPNMSALLNDADVRVRLTTATLLSQLLGESYLKLRPFLFFEMLSLVADPSAAVAAFARYSVLKVMLPKDQFLITNNIKETFFVFNNYQGHSKFNKLPTPILKLCGDNHRFSRVQLIRFLVAQVKNERDILRIHEQLNDVLEMCTEEGGVGGTKLNLLHTEGMNVFQDCIQVLLSAELNLSARTLESTAKDGKETTDLEEEEAEMRMRKSLWASAVKTRVRDVVCPVLCAVSARLRSLRSPLQRDLVHYAAYICQDYEKELNLFIADEQLQKDVISTLEETRRVRGKKLGMSVKESMDVDGAPALPPSTPCKDSLSRAGSEATPHTPSARRRISVSRYKNVRFELEHRCIQKGG